VNKSYDVDGYVHPRLCIPVVLDAIKHWARFRVAAILAEHLDLPDYPCAFDE